MTLSQKAVNDLKKIYLKEFGRVISDDKANILGTELLTFFKMIYQPIPKNEYEIIKKIK